MGNISKLGFPLDLPPPPPRMGGGGLGILLSEFVLQPSISITIEILHYGKLIISSTEMTEPIMIIKYFTKEILL
jgi:hypothetical protein